MTLVKKRRLKWFVHIARFLGKQRRFTGIGKYGNDKGAHQVKLWSKRCVVRLCSLYVDKASGRATKPKISYLKMFAFFFKGLSL